ncbi:hypothetical protein [Kitasatospora purpeofusca]|uniref:hypothetical protein n=1 Tax=Kitasatospora purpeofusca TaxID=67352 RepID=UPI0036D39B5A
MDSVHSVHDGTTTDRRTAEAHRVAVAFADALLALAPVDEQLHRRLAGVAGTLRDVWEEQVRDEALFLAHRHLEELVQVVCRDLPVAADDDAGANAEEGEEGDKDEDQEEGGAPPGAGAEPGDGDGGDEVPAHDGTPAPAAAAADEPPAEEQPGAADPDAPDTDGDTDTNSNPDTEDSPTGAPTAGEVADAEADDLRTIRQLLKNEIRTRWPAGPGRPGFRPQLLTPDPQIARGREASTDHRELARGLRLDALRLPVRDSAPLHRTLAEILGTDGPPDGTRLPGFGDVLEPVPLGQQSTDASPREQLPLLWARLIRLVDPEDGAVADRPPHVLPNQQRALCLILQHALDLIAVVRESLLVPHSGVVRANGLHHISALDEPTARNWESALLAWLVELSRIGRPTNTASRTAFLAKLTALDLTLAQIVTDPLPEGGSWWYDGRRQLRKEVNQLITTEGGKALGLFDSYPTKDISTVADTRALPGRAPNTVLWWLKLPYEPPGGQEPVRGQAICSDRQSTTARALGH